MANTTAAATANTPVTTPPIHSDAPGDTRTADTITQTINPNNGAVTSRATHNSMWSDGRMEAGYDR